MIAFGQRTPSLLVRAVAQTVSLTVYGSASPTIASGTYTLYAPDGTATTTTGAVTVSGATASITITPDSSLAYGGGYREVWALTLTGGTPYTVERPAVLGRIAVTATVQPGDLSATNRSLPGVCAFTETDPDTNAPTAVTWATYAWEKLDLAWGDILRDLTRNGRYPTRIMGLDLHAYHRWLTLQYIYQDLRVQQADLYDRLYSEAAARVLQLAGTATIGYDMDDDGVEDVTIVGVGPTADRANPNAGWPWGLV